MMLNSSFFFLLALYYKVMRTMHRDKGYWRRRALLQQARVLHGGVPTYVLARLYKVSTATISSWLNHGLLPARRASLARLASMLQITDDELVASVRSTDHEGGCNLP